MSRVPSEKNGKLFLYCLFKQAPLCFILSTTHKSFSISLLFSIWENVRAAERAKLSVIILSLQSMNILKKKRKKVSVCFSVIHPGHPVRHCAFV